MKLFVMLMLFMLTLPAICCGQDLEDLPYHQAEIIAIIHNPLGYGNRFDWKVVCIGSTAYIGARADTPITPILDPEMGQGSPMTCAQARIIFGQSKSLKRDVK